MIDGDRCAWRSPIRPSPRRVDKRHFTAKLNSPETFRAVARQLPDKGAAFDIGAGIHVKAIGAAVAGQRNLEVGAFTGRS